MRLVYKSVPQNSQLYAANLHLDEITNALKWKCAPGQVTMVIQMPYGDRASDMLDKLVERLNECDLDLDAYTRIMPGVFVWLFDASGLMGGCPLNGEACTYTVLACRISDGICEVFAPQEDSGAMMQYWCDIPLSLQAAVVAQTRSVGFGPFSRTESTGFYQIEFNYAGSFVDNYRDGDVYYEVGHTSVPITQRAIKQRVIYVKSDIRPKVFSSNKGMNVITVG